MIPLMTKTHAFMCWWGYWWRLHAWVWGWWWGTTLHYGPLERAVCAERKWMGVSLGRTFLSQWGRGGGGSSRVGMLPAHYWTEMLQLGGAMQNRKFCLTAFSRGSRKPQDVLLVVAHKRQTLEQKWAKAKRCALLWIPRPRREIINHRLSN